MTTTKTQLGDLEVTELSGEEAAEAISEFSGLELAPLYRTEDEQKLARADLLKTEGAKP